MFKNRFLFSLVSVGYMDIEAEGREQPIIENEAFERDDLYQNNSQKFAKVHKKMQY